MTIPATADNTMVFATPISSKTPRGEDPRYLDDFLFIKEELDKLANTDYEQIHRVSIQLLSETCKDLRVAAYYLLASVYVNGLAGLQEGLAGYRCIIDNFWDDCYPTSETARTAALGLLNTPRLTAFAEQREEEITADQLNTIVDDIEWINDFLIAKLGEEAPRLTNLATWSKKQQALLPAAEKPGETLATETVSGQSAAEVPSFPLPSSAETIGSIRELETEIRKMHSYLCDNGELYRAMTLSRAILWGYDHLPPHEQQQTRVPAPRSSAWAELQNLTAGNNFEQALLLSEKIFFEPGFRYCMALQQFAWQQTQQLNRPDLASLVTTSSKNHIERFPELYNLAFDDGTPFCDQETATWFDDLKEKQNHPASDCDNSQAETANIRLHEIMAEALPLARGKQLPEALAMVREISSEPALLKVRRSLSEAKLCLAGDKPDLAEAALEQLQEQTTENHLHVWHPELVLEIIQLRSKVLQKLLKGTDKASKAQLIKTQEDLQRSACRLDILAAARFL